MKFVFDTGSKWMWVQTDDCIGDGLEFLRDLCTSANEKYTVNKVIDESPVILKYGKGMAEGIVVKDRVCLDSKA